MATNTTGLASSRLFFVTDRTSYLRFLVDTGAEVSVLPVAQLSRASLSAGPPLQAVNNSNIATFGTVSRTLNLGHFGGVFSSLTSNTPSLVLIFSAISTSWWT